MPFDRPIFIWLYISLPKALALPCTQRYCAHQITAHSISSTDSCYYDHLEALAHKLHSSLCHFIIHTNSLLILHLNQLKSLPFHPKKTSSFLLWPNSFQLYHFDNTSRHCTRIQGLGYYMIEKSINLIPPKDQDKANFNTTPSMAYVRYLPQWKQEFETVIKVEYNKG